MTQPDKWDPHISQLYAETSSPRPAASGRPEAVKSEPGPAVALTALLCVVFLTALAIAPAVVIATWRALL